MSTAYSRAVTEVRADLYREGIGMGFDVLSAATYSDGVLCSPFGQVLLMQRLKKVRRRDLRDAVHGLLPFWLGGTRREKEDVGD